MNLLYLVKNFSLLENKFGSAELRWAESIRSTLSVADCLQLINTVDAIEVLEAFKRIPEEFRSFTFFGADDRWLYIISGNPKLCENCLGYDGEIFYGDSLRSEFPYLRIIDENTINPNVHPHCECLLIRVAA